MSIATEITRLKTAKANLKTAIEAKGVTVSSDAKLDDFPDLVESIPSGGGAIEEKLVNFYDYEGTLVASYTGTEAQALTALPDAPDHSTDEVPLTFDGWNWTLAEIKAYNTNCPEADINVGANYHTTDGLLHVFFSITNENRGYVEFKIRSYDSSRFSCLVDWGDGSEPESFPSEPVYYNATLSHTYLQLGEFHARISIEISSGQMVAVKFGKENFANDSYLVPNQNYSFYPENVRAIRNPSWTSGVCQDAYSSLINLKDVSIPASEGTQTSDLFSTTNLARFSSIKYLTIPRSSGIGSSMFLGCRDLKQCSFPPSISSGSSIYSFSMCSNLESITIPEGLTSLSKEMFYTCGKLKKVILPSSVSSISQTSFHECDALEIVKSYNPSLTISGSSVFSYCRNLLEIPALRGSIGTSFAQYCIRISEVVVYASSIGAYAFNGCSSLKTLSLTASVTTLGNYAFEGCLRLDSITIPENVTQIGSNAFRSCVHLETVIMEPSTPPNLTASSAFPSAYLKKIIVPAGTLSAYQSATNWSTFASIMEEATA